MDRLLTSDWWLDVAFAGVFGAVVSAFVAAFTAVRILRASARHENDRRDADRLLERVIILRGQVDQLRTLSRSAGPDTAHELRTLVYETQINALMVSTWAQANDKQFAAAVHAYWFRIPSGMLAHLTPDDGDPERQRERSRARSAISFLMSEIDGWFISPEAVRQRKDIVLQEDLAIVDRAKPKPEPTRHGRRGRHRR